MNNRLLLSIFCLVFLAGTTVRAEPFPPATNKDGSVVSGFLTADFELRAEEGLAIPFPFNLLFDGTPDLTLNPPVEDPTDFGDPTVALSALDGFSTTEKWTTSFTSFPNQLDPATVVPGQSVRFFEVSTVFGTIVIVSGLVRELTPGVDYVATMISADTLAIIPLKPLKELSTYMAVLTNDIKDTVGNDATPSQFYHLTKRATPWVDENGESQFALFDDATAASLEGVRQITASNEAAAASVGIPKEDIILSWTAQTQAVTPVLKSLRSIARPAPVTVVPTGANTSVVGGAGIADIYIGVITLPYYLGVPSADNPTAPLTEFFRAEPGAYVPPFDALGLDPTSTNVTVANPFPVETGKQTVPLLMSVPNAQSGMQRPAAGWPVVIFSHAATSNRASVLAVADSLAAAGFAVIAIDLPLHGITPQESSLASFYVENTPFADVANERTFDADYVNNATLAPGPDNSVDPSGTHFVNLRSLLTSRDNLRQAQADLSVLAVTVPTIDFSGDSLPDLDASTIAYAGVSLGSVAGTAFTAVEPMVPNAFLSTPMGGLARALVASQTFGPPILAGLAAAGVQPGTADFEQFLTVFQTVLDSADPINWSAEASMVNNILLHEVIDDSVFPNFVPTGPLSGTEPMIAAMGLAAYSSSRADPSGLDAVGRFLPPASHASLLSPATSPAATAEMQRQMATFLASRGRQVQVSDPSTMVPVAPPEPQAENQAGDD